MDFEKLLEHCKRYHKTKFIRVEQDGDYAIHRDGDTLYLFFQWSNGTSDWKNNFDFPAVPYKDMGVKWRCHRGFLRVWKSIEPYIKESVLDKTVAKVVIIGYSHGAAIATLAHEYVWYNRPDLRDSMEGYGIGCPKCYWGFSVKKSLRERWANFHPIRNENDIVTYVPPMPFGFVHVNKVTHLHGGIRQTDNAVEFKYKLNNLLLKITGAGAHYWSRYINGIEKLTKQND